MPACLDRRTLIALLFGSPAAVALGTAGCGGSSRDSRTGFTYPTVNLRMEWPTGNGLDAARSVVYNADESGASVGNTVISRGGAANATIRFLTENPKDHLFGVSLRSGEDGSGEILYQNLFFLHLRYGDNIVDAPITFGTTIQALSASIGRTYNNLISSLCAVQMVATARDSRGRIVLPPPGQFAWSTSDSAIAVVDGNGLVLRRGTGKVTITVRDTISGKQAGRDVEFEGEYLTDEFPVPGDNVVWVSGTSEIWMAQNGHQGHYGRLLTIDPVTRTITGTIPLTGTPDIIAPAGDGQGAFVLHGRTPGRWGVLREGSALSYVDASSRTVRFLADMTTVAESLYQLVPAPRSSRRVAMLGASPTSGYVLMVFEEGRLLGRFPFDTLNYYGSIGWGRNDNRLYASNAKGPGPGQGGTILYRFDVESDGISLASTAEDVLAQESFSARDGLLFDARRRVIDGETGEVITSNVGGGSDMVALDDYDSGRVYYLGYTTIGATPYIEAYSTTTNSILGQQVIPSSNFSSYTKLLRLSDRNMATFGGNELTILNNLPFL